MGLTLQLDGEAYHAIVDHAAAAGTDECCGVLVGSDHSEADRREVREAWPITNIAPARVRPHRFTLDPLELMKLERRADDAGLRVLGIYHSHPNGVCRPSEVDRREAWGWYSYLIVAPSPDGWQVGAWRLVADRFEAEDVDLVATS